MKAHSIWESTGFYRQPHVAVIGGGITGLFTALFYKREFPDHHVVVLEKGPFPSGASVKNAGFACFGSPSELLYDIDNEGIESALKRVDLRWRGLRELREELGDENIGIQGKGGHEVLFPDTPLYTRVRDRFDELNEALRPVLGAGTFHWADELAGKFGLGRDVHLVRTGLEAQLDSGKLMSSLLRRTMACGVVFRGNTEVVSIEEEGNAVKIRIADGTTLSAAQVVLATNAWTGRFAPELDIVPGRGQVVLTAPVPGLRLNGTFHYNEGFYYFRDLNGGVLLGGGRELDMPAEATLEEGVSFLVQDALERMLREIILPGREFEIVQRWSGIMAFGGHSKSPLIQRRSERIVVAARLGGMGVAIGIRVAREAAALLAGREITAF